jgi:hypothetical protein
MSLKLILGPKAPLSRKCKGGTFPTQVAEFGRVYWASRFDAQVNIISKML